MKAGRLKSVLFAVILMAAGFGASSGTAIAQEVSKSQSLTVLNYVTGWVHDSAGYHPTVFMVLENTSNQDLSNRPIKFQARFTDLQTAEVTIGRKELRRDLKPHQQVSVGVIGQQGYELPFEIQQWPSIEAKVMARIGNVGDEGTETLMIAKVEQTTHTEEEAFEHLNQATSYAPRPRSTAAERPSKPSRRREPPAEKPALAHAAKLTDAPHAVPGRVSAEEHPKAPRSRTKSDSGSLGGPMSLLSSKLLPGLGDDFYVFEQRFGLPKDYDAKHSDWTWARYEHKPTGVEVIAGAHDRKGSVDVIVVKVPASGSLDEVSLSNCASNFAGKLHNQALSGPSKSVRYLPAGRLQLVARNASGYKVLSISPNDESDNSFILIISRVPQDVEQLLAAQTQKCSLLKCVRFLEIPKDAGRD